LPELVEAAVRAGDSELAAKTNQRLRDCAHASGTEWALGIAARSNALLAGDDLAGDFYVEAIQHLSRTRIATDLARAHLLHGEWLRRHRRRVDARTELGIAYEMFTGFGMKAFAERARVELHATGGRTRTKSAGAMGELTPQEINVSRLAAQGNSNREIAGQLFISESTVEYHLVKAFRKLDIKSRTQLASRLQ
jgi:DNA-binding CsgD family transcriptional regulator